MELYRIEPDNMTRISERDLNEEEQLENRLVRTEAAQIGDVELLYVGRQGTVETGGIFDILAIDELGNTVVVELKRDEAPRSVITQALEYASEIQNAEYSYLNSRYESFLREEQGYDDEPLSLQEAHADHFDLDEPLSAREFNNEQRLIIVASEFDDDKLLNMADFLRDHDIDVIAVEHSTYRDDDSDIELLATDAIRRPLTQEPSTAGGSDHHPQPWKDDGKEWHLKEKTNPETSELLEEVVNRLSTIDFLQKPSWGQRYYIAFDDQNGERQFTINTQATQIKIRIRKLLDSPEDRREIANQIGIPEENIEQTANSRDQPRVIIRCRPDYDIKLSALRDEVEQLLSSSAD
jgi:hypothetical protein